MSGFQISGAQYVYFCGADNVVHEYTYGNNGDFAWVDNALPTGKSGGTCAAAPVGIVALVTSPNNNRHVYYEAESGSATSSQIRQLYYDGSTWTNEKFSTLIKGAKTSEQKAPMSGFAVGNDQYVFFQGSNGHIYEFSYVDNWAQTDLTEAAGVKKAGTGLNGVAALEVSSSQFEVYYAATKTNDMHQLTFLNNQWTDTNLTAQTGGSGPVKSSQMAAVLTIGNYHVFLVEGTDIFQLYYDGTDWVNQELPSVSTGAGGMAGFAISNLQYVYYISN